MTLQKVQIKHMTVRYTVATILSKNKRYITLAFRFSHMDRKKAETEHNVMEWNQLFCYLLYASCFLSLTIVVRRVAINKNIPANVGGQPCTFFY